MSVVKKDPCSFFKFLIATSTVLLLTISSLATARAEDWPKYKRDLANSGHSAEQGIDASNVGSLMVKWKFPTASKISASATIATINGRSMVFIGAWSGDFFALNAVTGKKIWSFTVDMVGSCSSGGCQIASTAAVDKATNMVFFGAQNAYLYALNAIDGTLIWKRSVGNANTHPIWSSPAVYRGKVYIGVAGNEFDSPCVQGRVDAYDKLTGKPVWKFNTIDQTTCPSGTCVGGAVWSSVAIDSTNGIVYAGTGNPGDTCSPSTANAQLYPDSVLALKADTGSLLNFYQAISNDLKDDDFGASPILHATTVVDQCAGTTTTKQWVTAVNKTNLFTLRRGPGGLTGGVQKRSGFSEVIASPGLHPFNTSSSCAAGMNIINRGNHIFVPDTNGVLSIWSQGGGGAVSLMAQKSLGTVLYSTPAVIRNVVLFGGDDGNFYAMRVGGSIIKKFAVTNGDQIWSGPSISNGRVYFGSNGAGNVYCMSINGN